MVYVHCWVGAYAGEEGVAYGVASEDVVEVVES